MVGVISLRLSSPRSRRGPCRLRNTGLADVDVIGMAAGAADATAAATDVVPKDV